jgi:transposase
VDHVLVAIDEAGFQLTPNFKRIWFPRGETPKGAFFWSTKKLTVFGALTSEHDFFYEFYDAQNSMTFKHFLGEFFAQLNPEKRYVLILDNAGFHKTDVIKRYIQRQKNVVVEHIPPYSPELNPIETCWRVTKNAVTKSQYFTSIEKLQEALEQFWTTHKFMQQFITYLCR